MPTYLSPGVYVEEVDTGSKPLAAVATAVAAFIGFTAKAPPDKPDDLEGVKPRLVTSWSQFVKLYGGFAKGKMLPYSVYGYFNNGGARAYIVRIPDRLMPRESIALTEGTQDEDQLHFTAFSEAEEAITVEIATARDATDKDGKEVKQLEEGTFDVIVKSGPDKTETIQDVSFTSGGNHIATRVNELSKYLTAYAPELKNVNLTDIGLPTGEIELKPKGIPARFDVDGAAFSGEEVGRTGIEGLVIADDVTMLIAPDLVTIATKPNGDIDHVTWKKVQGAMLTHCTDHGDRMAILDTPPDLKTPQDVADWRKDAEEGPGASMFGALYYPWLKVDDPVGVNGKKTILIPPSGHMAGIWARTDETRGVWKAPANEEVLSVLGLKDTVTHRDQEGLNPIGVNCIRPFGLRGIRVWGARTLAEPNWQYINVRRLFNMIEKTIFIGTQWVVFEPNDQALWARVRRTVHSFLLGLWRDGALFGASADEAFYVKCDAETNPPDSIDLGRLVVEVGIAPVKPAEFVIFRISQLRPEADGG